MTETNLVVLAAGLGSRFGGSKQIAPLGPNGEILIEYSIYDAVKAGFDKIVMIIKKENEEEMRRILSKRIEKLAKVEYVYQSLDMLPAGFVVPEGRTKPWGTAHAILCCKGAVNSPFGIINADDYYGYESYKILHDHLVSSEEMCNVAFRLGATLSENGSVSRGICKEKNGYLTELVEQRAITKDSGFSLDALCSMNMWGARPSFFAVLEEAFVSFLKSVSDPLKDECYLPTVIGERIKVSGEKVRLLTTTAKWFGVTYQEDVDDVKTKLKDLVDRGYYRGL